MKTIHFISLLITLNTLILHSQVKDIWTAYEDESSGLYGFKDEDGNIKVTPGYLGFMLAQKFTDIVAVMEENNKSYYLTKKGTKVGSDSLFMSDNSFDCESEGFIRFSDKKKSTVGMFSSEGIVVIPADYNFLSQVRNGLIIGVKGGRKEYWNNDSTDEHWSIKGGTIYLIDVKNNILVKDFTGEDNLDYNSLTIEDEPSTDSLKESFTGVNGKFYTFYDNEKTFKNWFIYNFLDGLNKDNLLNHTYSKVMYWTEDNGWVSKTGKDFIEDNFDLIISSLGDLKSDSADYFISLESFVITQPELGKEFERYFDNCGNLKITQYPLMDVVINHKNGNDFYQDHFEFFKTENGFKLLMVTIRNGQLK